MPEETPMYRITFEDCFCVSQEIEQEFSVAITWRHTHHVSQQKWKFNVQLTAWEVGPEGLVKAVCSSYAAYPSGNHRTMAGAVLEGLYDLRSRLEAQRLLRQLPIDWDLR